MKFSRTLSPSFITALNNLYEDEKSWWRKIADDGDVFPLIRRNQLRVQANGGLLMEIMQDRQQRLTCRCVEEYLILRSESRYIMLGESARTPIPAVDSTKEFVNHYDNIKRRIFTFQGQERQAVQYLANSIPNIIDIEVGFEGEKEENAGKKSVPRIDFVAIRNETLVFFEVKLFENKEIRSLNTPKIVEQLKKYEQLLAEKHEEIIEGYREQLKIYRQLKGQFFKKKSEALRDIANFTLYPRVRLVITGFDGSQKQMLDSYVEGIERGLRWGKDDKDLIKVGDHKNLARSNRLFLGLK